MDNGWKPSSDGPKSMEGCADWICQAVVDAKEAKRWVAIVGLMTWRIDQRYLFRNCETGLEQTVGFV